MWEKEPKGAKKRTLTISGERPMCIISALQADVRIRFRKTAWQMTSDKLVSYFPTSRQFFGFRQFIHYVVHEPNSDISMLCDIDSCDSWLGIALRVVVNTGNILALAPKTQLWPVS